MDISQYPDLLSIQQCCEILGMHRVTFWRKKKGMAERGVKFLTIYPGCRTVRIDRDSLFEYLDAMMLGQDD